MVSSIQTELMASAKPTESTKNILETTGTSQNGIEAEEEIGAVQDQESVIHLCAIVATRGMVG